MSKPKGGNTRGSSPQSRIRQNPFFAGPAVPQWNRPIPGSTYPLTLVHEGEDPTIGSVRFMGGMMAVMLLASYAIVVPLVNTGVMRLGFTTDSGGLSWEDYYRVAQQQSSIWSIIGSHLGLATMIAVVWAYYRFIHRRRMEWMWSVSPGVRWRYGILCVGVALIVVGAVAGYNWVTGPGWAPADNWRWYLMTICISVPFQALAEEVVFRGYLMQLFGSIIRNVWFPIVGTALIFAILHGYQNPWLFGSRFLFGVIAGILVWRTGGLEAAVAIHIVNNLLVYMLSIFTGTVAEVRGADSIPWTQTLTDLGMFTVCALGCWAVAVGMRVPLKVRKQ